jgi:hypothetical protein
MLAVLKQRTFKGAECETENFDSIYLVAEKFH